MKELGALKKRLSSMGASECRHFFELSEEVRLLKTTISLCPLCLQHVLGVVYSESSKVFVKKYCLDHSFSTALMEGDENYYFLSNKDQWGKRFDETKIFEIPTGENACCGGGSCGPQSSLAMNHHFTDQMANKTCTILVEVTDACNLACAVCYADSKGDRFLPLEVFKKHILDLVEKKGILDSVQVTGGEASLHPHYWDMLTFLHEQESIKKIYLPTNGLLFKSEDFIQNVVRLRDKVMVLLQFDGVSDKTDEFLRNAHLSRTRKEILDALAIKNISTQLTMTLAIDVNENELGDLLDLGFRYKNIKVLALQPATFSGRYGRDVDGMKRLTLSDIVKAVLSQVEVKTADKDFVPVPCSHPNCGWLTLYFRRLGLKKNLIPFTDLKLSMETVANKAMLSSEEVQNALQKSQKGILKKATMFLGKKLVRSQDVLTVAIKPFMDRFNYDQDRISSCCHHLMDTEGNPVSFCEYNALLRPKDRWDKFPLVENL